MLTIKVTCQGVSPLLMNPMSDETLEGLRTGVRTSKPTDLTSEQEAEKKLYKDSNNGNMIGIPALNLYSCMIEAGRSVKNGKKQISTKDSSSLPSFLQIDEEFLPFINEAKWVVDKRRGRLPKDGTAVCLVRPKFPEWEFKVTLRVDETICAENTARKLVETAGNSIGLGAFRPTCRGPFGRFKITEWKVQK